MDITANEVIMTELEEIFFAGLVATEDMVTFEKDSSDAIREAQNEAATRALERFDQYLFENKSPELKSKGFESRKMLETYGDLSFRRRRYTYRGKNCYLLDEVLGLPTYSSHTSSVTHFLAARARTDSYENATKDLLEKSGVKVPRSSVKRAIATCVGALEEQRTEIKGPKKKIAHLDIESDDIALPLQRSKQQKKANTTSADKDKRFWHYFTILKGYEGKELTKYQNRKRCISPFYITGALGTEDVFERASEYIDAYYSVEHISHIHFGSDGASNQRLGRDILPGKVIDSLDPYHVFKKLRDLLEADVFRAVKSNLYKKDYQEIARICKNAFDYYELTEQKQLAENICKAAKYLNKNIYLIARGLTHSLGTAESANAKIAADRCKGRGRAWSVEGAANVLALNAAIASGQVIPHVRRKQTEPRLSELAKIVKATHKSCKEKKIRGNHYYNQVLLPDIERTKGTYTHSAAQ